FLFTKAILEGKPIDVFNEGNMKRDFTYVDDIVEAIVRMVPSPTKGNSEWNGLAPDPATSSAPWRVYNIGNNSPVRLLDFIQTLERKLGRNAVMNYLPMQDGDVPETFADVDALARDFDFRPGTDLETGIGKFVDWYVDYYNINL
ncbi:MAG: NAD-dependent epimerase/dehydratase family protein, partial [Bacteroidota bacterium]